MDEVGNDQDYNVFREKLIAAKEKSGKSRTSYAIYDVEFELAEGEGKRYERLILWPRSIGLTSRSIGPRLLSLHTSTRTKLLSRYVR